MARAVSHTKVHRVKRANSTVHVFHRNIFPVRVTRPIRQSLANCNFINSSVFVLCFLFFADTNCTYLFLATPNEQVTIVFDVFKVKADNANATSGAYG